MRGLREKPDGRMKANEKFLDVTQLSGDAGVQIQLIRRDLLSILGTLLKPQKTTP